MRISKYAKIPPKYKLHSVAKRGMWYYSNQYKCWLPVRYNTYFVAKK